MRLPLGAINDACQGLLMSATFFAGLLETPKYLDDAPLCLLPKPCPIAGPLGIVVIVGDPQVYGKMAPVRGGAKKEQPTPGPVFSSLLSTTPPMPACIAGR
jgi:hypothetical protein